MKMFRVLVLAIALIAGGAAAYLALNLGSSEPTVVAEAPQIDTRDVLIAVGNIAPGTSITADNVRWQAFPADIVNPTYIDKASRPDAMTELVGTVVRSMFVEGEPIRNGKLARPESGFMSAILPSGMRAIAVRVSAQSTAGGFILPNDRVDVIHTIHSEGAEGAAGSSVSQTILDNIRVLAIDQTVEEQDGERVVVGKTATLELDPSQVEIMTAAEASGVISLSLRSMADSDEESVARKRKKTGTVQVFRSGRGNLVQTR